MGTLPASVVGSLVQIVESACLDTTKDIPGVTVVVVSKNGEELFSHSAGKRGVGSKEPMTLDSIFWIASCTKLITGIACMQLVEKGILDLESVELVESLCPELKEAKVLSDDGSFVEKTRGITLRMLLSHTGNCYKTESTKMLTTVKAGFGYSFFNDKLRDFNKPVGYDEFSGSFLDMKQPLVNQPGARWEYGVSFV